MGAQPFTHLIEGSNPSECFERLVNDAIYEYGNDSYNGTISTCTLGRMTVLADKYSDTVLKRARKKVNDDENGDKRVATVLDLGVVGYDIVTAKKVPVKAKEKAEYRTKFVVLKEAYDSSKVIATKETKTEADEYAISQALKEPNFDYRVAKRPVKINKGSEYLTDIEISVKRVKTKPKKAPKNAVVSEAHKYLFYGWAAS